MYKSTLRPKSSKAPSSVETSAVSKKPDTQIHRVRPRETVALNTHDRVRLCPKDDGDGVHYTDFRFVLNLTDNETQSPPWDTQESLGEDESLPLPLSYEEGQVESLPLSLP